MLSRGPISLRSDEVCSSTVGFTALGYIFVGSIWLLIRFTVIISKFEILICNRLDSFCVLTPNLIFHLLMLSCRYCALQMEQCACELICFSGHFYCTLTREKIIPTATSNFIVRCSLLKLFT